jgi:hypothetical protein
VITWARTANCLLRSNPRQEGLVLGVHDGLDGEHASRQGRDRNMASQRSTCLASWAFRHEDAVTESGCENFAPKWSGTLEEPAVV